MEDDSEDAWRRKGWSSSSLVLVGSRLPRVRSVCALVWSAGCTKVVCPESQRHHGAERPITK